MWAHPRKALSTEKVSFLAFPPSTVPSLALPQLLLLLLAMLPSPSSPDSSEEGGEVRGLLSSPAWTTPPTPSVGDGRQRPPPAASALGSPGGDAANLATPDSRWFGFQRRSKKA